MRNYTTLLFGLFALATWLSPVGADEDKTKAKKLEVGDKAPTFQAKDDTGKLWKSSDHVGKKGLIVFFYPAAMTGG